METALYPPIKHFLEARGFTVKGEIKGCDVVAVAEGAPPLVVICELKQTFTLELVLQAVERADYCDEIWLAVRKSASGRERDTRVRRLCRRLGFGLLAVTDAGLVEIVANPETPPRRDPKRRSQLLTEHRRRIGDPSMGGSTRTAIMTAYRQQALACAAAIAVAPQRPRDLKPSIPEAPKILLHNFYGWFERIERGVYGLTDAGRAALVRWPSQRSAE